MLPSHPVGQYITRRRRGAAGCAAVRTSETLATSAASQNHDLLPPSRAAARNYIAERRSGQTCGPSEPSDGSKPLLHAEQVAVSRGEVEARYWHGHGRRLLPAPLITGQLDGSACGSSHEGPTDGRAIRHTSTCHTYTTLTDDPLSPLSSFVYMLYLASLRALSSTHLKPYQSPILYCTAVLTGPSITTPYTRYTTALQSEPRRNRKLVQRTEQRCRRRHIMRSILVGLCHVNHGHAAGNGRFNVAIKSRRCSIHKNLITSSRGYHNDRANFLFVSGFDTENTSTIQQSR